MCLEKATVIEQLFHSHVGDDRTGFTFDDTLDDVLYMVASSGDGLRAFAADLAVGVTCEKHSVLL